MLLKFSYDIEVAFSEPVTRHFYRLKCVPADTRRQKILQTQLEINPSGERGRYVDFWGTEVLCGRIPEPHKGFFVSLSGIAGTGLDICEEYSIADEIYTVQSAYTACGPSVKAFRREITADAPENRYERAVYLMRRVHGAMSYTPQSTNIKTTAEEAIRNRQGVCQDYAHILLSLLRAEGYPSRYVVGMMTGEGKSHAWTEVNLLGYWYGLDPTNNLLVDDRYIKISHGRDYGDCVVSKGVFFGAARQAQNVRVAVTEMKEGKIDYD